MERISEERKRPLFPRYMDSELNVDIEVETKEPLFPRFFESTRQPAAELLSDTSNEVSQKGTD